MKSTQIFKARKAIFNECIIALVLALITFSIFHWFFQGMTNRIGSAVSFLPLIIVVRNLIRLKKPLLFLEKKKLFYNNFSGTSEIDSFKIVTLHKKEFFEFKGSKRNITTEVSAFTDFDIKRLRSLKQFKKN